MRSKNSICGERETKLRVRKAQNIKLHFISAHKHKYAHTYEHFHIYMRNRNGTIMYFHTYQWVSDYHFALCRFRRHTSCAVCSLLNRLSSILVPHLYVFHVAKSSCMYGSILSRKEKKDVHVSSQASRIHFFVCSVPYTKSFMQDNVLT